jgi:epsilon-lactone hydrolase
VANTDSDDPVAFEAGISGAQIGRPSEQTPVSNASYVNIPEWVSAEMKAFLRLLTDPAKSVPPFPDPTDFEGWDKFAQIMELQWAAKDEPYIKSVEPTIKHVKFGGVPCVDIRPKNWTDNGKVLIYFHGGAFVFYRAGGSMLSRGVTAADQWGLRVVSVDYTLAPRAKYNQITDECVAVIKALMQQGTMVENIAIYGDSAGGGLGAAVVLKIRDQGVGLSAALAVLSPWLDLTQDPDTVTSLQNQETSYTQKHQIAAAAAYADPKDHKDPYASAVYGDFSKGYCPTIIQVGLKEILLSGCVRFYQKLDEAKIPVKLDPYEAMPHNFSVRVPHAPESITARKKMRDFLHQHLGMK